ncbi:choice-of-anchor L domain-containing protein, partial [Flavobacterium gelidilacus]
MMKKITLLFILFSAFVGFSQAITVNPAAAGSGAGSVQDIVQNILINSPCAQVSNFQTQGLCGVGSFGYTGSNFGFAGGMILRNGNVNFSSGQYSGNNISSVCSNLGDAELLAISQANGNTGVLTDVSFIKFNFTPLTDSFSFNFIFASNEYGTYQCDYSDVFAFILTDLTTGISTNLALIPGTTTPVSVTNVCDTAFNTTCPSVNPTFFDTYNVGLPAASTVMNMKGYTVEMTAFANVIPNNSYSIKLAIGDYGPTFPDSGWDSAVFIEAGSFNVGTANLSYPVGVGIETSDMTIANGLAPCPGDIRVLDTGLNPASYNFEWTLDGNVLTSETGPTLSVSSPGVYCVNASNVGSGGNCSQIDCITVEYQPGFVINNNPNNLFSCDNNFDLSENSVTILNGLDPFTYDVLFYATMQNAIDNISQIPALQTTTATVTTFYVRVETFGNTCAQITQFDAVVSPCQASSPPDMIVCDDITNNGTETFNLTTQNAAVLGGLTASDFTITYHLDQAGADANNNLALPATAYVGGPNQVIYVRMESNANPAQYSTTSFNLIVNALPTAAIGASTICSGQTATVTISGTPGATVSYLDYLGATQTVVLNSSGSATVTTPVLTSNATYSLVDVTSVENCTRAVNGTATVTINPLPTVSISTTTPSICSGTSATIDFAGTANATITY